MNNIQEVIKARALEALHADRLPTDPWALKNRVAITVLKVNTDLLTENMATRNSNIPSLTKADQKSIQRDILKELSNASR